MPRPGTSFLIGALLSGGVVVAGCGTDVVTIPPTQEEAPTLPSGTPDVPPDPPPPVCAEATGVYIPTREPSNVLFLFDRSGSMHIQLPSKATRWEATKKGFFDLLGALPQSTGVGLMLFPQGDQPVNAWCGINASINDVDCDTGWPEPSGALRCDASKYVANVPAALLREGQANAMRQQIIASDRSFYWGTPLATALTAAIATQKASTLPGAKSVILLTDGNPTSCGDAGISNDIKHVVAAAKAGLDGALVRTFVIGLTDSSRQAAKAENLSPIAVAGGTKRRADCEATNDCFYRLTDANFAGDLKKVFEEVSLQAFDCTFNLPEQTTGADPSLLSVQLTSAGTAKTLSRDPKKQDGWDYLPNGTQIQLYGGACTEMRNPSAQLRIVIGCETVTPSAPPSGPSIKRPQ
jgi:hypothetical protein